MKQRKHKQLWYPSMTELGKRISSTYLIFSKAVQSTLILDDLNALLIFFGS